MQLMLLHVKIYVETKKAKQQQEQKRGCGSAASDDGHYLDFIKIAEGLAAVAAAAAAR